ncbi:helix-turn-helix domain-containing protein [Tabrizicola sp.]|jgi:HTH-type transcriptional regulator/antitoxin HigA|uniref:helix-turn-helix domain-containing protein n=1 Tax=Tabrizicola sp. TaxID=2005166 RepID=UPI001A3AF834|nr:helix-turn-helix domain-containing protein [Tabrizicola sp.]MBL9064030.1 helix-turn-helix domain-containing protein [Tabrizicola sp.]
MPDYKTPGQLIEALLEQKGWTQRALGVVLDKADTTINRLISGKASLDAETALMLEEVFSVPAEEFLRLQKGYDLAQARIVMRPDPARAVRATLYGDLPLADMIKRGWISAENIRDTENVDKGLMRFFGVNRPEDIEVLPHAAKKTAVNTDATPAQIAWLYRVKQMATGILAKPYSKQALLAALPKLKALAVSPEGAAQVPRILAECGIRFVVVETLPAAKIDGVCFWLNPNAPVIGLTLRFDRIDNFWFVLRHEIEHVLQGHGMSSVVLDAGLEGERAGTGPDVNDEERQANLAAQDFLVPVHQMDAFIARKAPFFSERDLLGFAKIMRVHPGIVAGQLQRQTNRYDRFREHLAKIRANILPNVFKDGWGDVAPIEQ